MRTRRPTNLLLGLIPFAIAIILLLNNLDAIPDGLYDLLQRSWPVLLVILGVSMLLRGRFALSDIAAIIVGFALVAGIGFVAFSSRQTELRDDQQVVISQDVGEDVTLLAVNIEVLSTDVELRRTEGDTRVIQGEFVGSEESDISLTYTDGGNGIGEFTLIERQSSDFPVLDAVGRGTLLIEIPVDMGIAVAFAGDQGAVTFNMADLQLERLNVELDKGDVLVTLPEYQPRSPNATDQPGQVTSHNGDVTLFIPRNVAATLELDRGGSDTRPQFDDAYILIDDGADGTLEKRNVTDEDIPLFYRIAAPNGLIRLELTGDQ